MRSARNPRAGVDTEPRAGGENHHGLHARSGRPHARQTVGQDCPRAGQADCFRGGVRTSAHGSRCREDAGHPEVPARGVRRLRADGRGDGVGVDRSGRRHPLHRVVPDARQGQGEPDGQPGRRDEGIGDHRPRVGHGPL